ncbi:MAG: hypothetical protein Ct9H300mP8_13350 [Gammaproteobacteria bacterium]|nr:MAG: hypothetical protein Ct9H300mP8_13350 [Gammaproteobacteria bacterium]
MGCPSRGRTRTDHQEQPCEHHRAVIVEPFAGSGGVLVPPVGYLERLREITEAHGILLIFDEVITAFGRLGWSSAAERLGVVPDIMCTAKGLTSGPCRWVRSWSARKFEKRLCKAPLGDRFFHGYPYSGHPLAAAAAHARWTCTKTKVFFGTSGG